MIVYHGSTHLFDYPDYAEMTERCNTPRSFPLGLWASPRIEVARQFGNHIYEMDLDAFPEFIRTDDLLSRPRHIHIRDRRDVILTKERNVLVINFDVIRDFRYMGDREHVRRIAACM